MLTEKSYNEDIAIKKWLVSYFIKCRYLSRFVKTVVCMYLISDFTYFLAMEIPPYLNQILEMAII